MQLCAGVNAPATLYNKSLTDELAAVESAAEAATVVEELSALTDRARQAGFTFLESVVATDPDTPFDLTFMLQNPDFDTDATTGWTTATDPNYGGGGAEFYEKTFNFYQTLTNMPKGIYELHAQAFQRPGETEDAYAKYAAGSGKVTTLLYMGSATATVKHICDDRQPKALFNDGGWGSDKKLGDGTYVPNCMDGAACYFAKNLYDNSVELKNTSSGANIKAGIRCSSAPSVYWTMFDHFRLYFFGQEKIVATVKGDANGDGKVDIVDVTTTISYILGQTPATFKQAAADVNGDSKVDIVDVTSIIDIILTR